VVGAPTHDPPIELDARAIACTIVVIVAHRRARRSTRILDRRTAFDDYVDRLRTNAPSDGIFDDDVHDERARGDERVSNHTE